MAGQQRPPAPPSPAQRQAEAAEQQVGELRHIGGLLELLAERTAPERPPSRSSDLRMTWDPDDGAQGRWMGFLRSVPGLMAQFQRVPAAYWTREVAVDDNEQVENGGYTEQVPVAVVKCPCGTDNIVETTQECAGTLKDGEPCKRFYLFIANRVYVTNSPLQRMAPWQRIALGHRARP